MGKNLKIKMTVLALFVITVLFFSSLSSSYIPLTTGKITQGGIKKIKSLEEDDVNAIQKKIDEKQQNFIAQKELDSSNFTNSDYKTFFKNTVFMGDSLTQPLDFYGFLDSTSVVAEKGRYVVAALNDVDKVASLYPTRVIMLYGMNDLGYYPQIEDFITNYKILINKVKSKLPKAEIVILSPLYVTKTAQINSPEVSTDRIDKSNELIVEMCEEEEIEYIDIREIITKNPNLYEPDGMHVVADFYNKLLDLLILKLRF